MIITEITRKYLLRYNNTDLSFAEDVYVVNWLGGGITDIVSTVAFGSGDGSHIEKYHSSDRQIIINIRVFNERQKQAIYKLFQPRKKGVLSYIPEGDESRTKQIDCVVTSAEPNESKFPTIIPVILLCPYPFWRSATESKAIICGEVDGWSFPWGYKKERDFSFGEIKSGSSVVFSVNGTVATGFTAAITTYQPITYLRLASHYNGKWIAIEGDYAADTEIVIDTNKGNCKVLSGRVGVTEYIDISDDVVWGSTYFTLIPGQNRITLEATNGTSGLEASVSFSVKYGGV